MREKWTDWADSRASWEKGCKRRLNLDPGADVVIVQRPREGYFIRRAFDRWDKPVAYLAGPFETEEAAMAAVELMTS